MFSEFVNEPMLYEALMRSFGPKVEEIVEEKQKETAYDLARKAGRLLIEEKTVAQALRILESTEIDEDVLDATELEWCVRRFLKESNNGTFIVRARKLLDKYAQMREVSWTRKRKSSSPSEVPVKKARQINRCDQKTPMLLPSSSRRLSMPITSLVVEKKTTGITKQNLVNDKRKSLPTNDPLVSHLGESRRVAHAPKKAEPMKIIKSKEPVKTTVSRPAKAPVSQDLLGTIFDEMASR